MIYIKLVPMTASNFTWSSETVYQNLLSVQNYSTEMPLNSSYLGNNLPISYNWGVLFLVPIILFGITGNVLVCMAVSMEKRLQTVTNYFLFSLAVTDLHVCIIVMPISIINDFIGYWRFSHVLCSVYTTLDVLMCTSSILHLCSISLERYLAIRNPLKSRNKSKSIVLLKISLIWATAAAISSPVTVLGVLDQSNILNNRQCTLTNNGFIVYGSILAFFIPLVIMVVSYGLTIRLLHKQSKLYDPNRNVAKSGEPILRRVKSRRHKCTSKSSPTPSRQSFSSTRDHGMYEMGLKSKRQMSLAECGRSLRIPNIISHSASCQTIYSSSEEHVQSSRCFLSVPSNRANGSSSESLISDNETTSDDESRSYIHMSGTESPGKRSLRDVMTKQIIIKASSILNLTRDKNSDKTTVRTEQKASKVLGFVFAIFVMCWTPFFVVNILTALCKVCFFNPILLSTFVWLGWISSTINPIIYTMFNCTFKQTFIKLIKCQYGFLQKPGNRRLESLKTTEYNMNVPL